MSSGRFRPGRVAEAEVRSRGREDYYKGADEEKKPLKVREFSVKALSIVTL